MAHLWIWDSSQWTVMQLGDAAFSLSALHPAGTPPGPEPAIEAEALLMPGWDQQAARSWVLIAGERSEVRVNGTLPTAGIRILRDRDEIRLPGAEPYYFSTECLAAVVPFAGSGPAAFCPRCKQALEPAHPCVKCPGCGIVYHESADLPCWTYSETCALCPQPTSMEAGYRWTPEDL